MSSVLVGVERAGGFAATEAGMFVGTSAGSIVAAVLAAGVDPADRLGALPELPEAGVGAPTGEDPDGLIDVIAQGVGGPLAALVLSTAAPGGRFLRRSALSRVPRGIRSLAELRAAIDSTRVRFDGRLRICAVDLERGERIVFGAADEPHTAVGAAVEASCAIPGVFTPVEIDGRDYVDGGVWSPTNMDAAEVADGSQVVCLNPTGSMRPGASQSVGWLGPLSRTVATIEATALRRRGAKVTVVAPDADASAAIGDNLMRGSARSAVIEAGFRQGAALAAS